MTTTTVEEERYILVDCVANNNKWWHITRDSLTRITTTFGRVGYSGQSSTQTFDSPEKADKFWSSKIREKTTKGYTRQQTIDNASQQLPVTQSLNEIAKAQIKSDGNETTKLIEYLVKANAHNIFQATGGKIKYDVAEGVFRTPLGIITQDAVDEARKVLDSMTGYIEKQDFKSVVYLDLLGKYLRLVPQNIGMKMKPELIYPDLEAVQKQSQILDALESALTDVVKATPGAVAPKVFDVTLTAVSKDDPEFKMIQKFYRDNLNRMHTSSSLDVKAVWKLEIKHMADAFKAKGKAMGNVKQLWHGTRTANLLSILKSGYVIPPSSASHCTGRMFGDGIYFSDQSTKSLNYAQGYWSGGATDNNCFMLLNNVAMGKEYTPSHSCSSKPPAGYDSYFAKAGKSGVQNNEMIVFNTYQVNPKFLVQFSQGGR